MKYDFLLVGTGLFNGVFAYEAMRRGKSCIAVEKRNHIGGNIYTETIEDIHIHTYGAHIFKTSDQGIWEYMQQFAEFNHFINTPIANYHGEMYNLPFNMNTFTRMWGGVTPEQAKTIIKGQSSHAARPSDNLEDHIIHLVGVDLYEKLVKGYTEKQWGKPCSDLPKDLMRRIPLRFTYNNNYYDETYQGIPIGGYTPMIEKMFSGCRIVLGTDFNLHREKLWETAREIIYSGPIDAFFSYSLGALEYRSLRFETEILDTPNYQGVAVMNYTDIETPFTRIIEHKHFEFGNQKKTVISREYPIAWRKGMEPFYPINDKTNNERYDAYARLKSEVPNVQFGGRLGEYQYYDMQDTVKAALKLVKERL